MVWKQSIILQKNLKDVPSYWDFTLQQCTVSDVLMVLSTDWSQSILTDWHHTCFFLYTDFAKITSQYRSEKLLKYALIPKKKKTQEFKIICKCLKKLTKIFQFHWNVKHSVVLSLAHVDTNRCDRFIIQVKCLVFAQIMLATMRKSFIISLSTTDISMKN